MANADHCELLRQGVEAWNAWRAKEPRVRPDLSDAKLSGASLSNANLRNANLRGADLSQAELTCANLGRAELMDANLTRANLPGAILIETGLIRACLWGANLRCAKLQRANLEMADLATALLIRANLFEARMHRASLARANLKGANLRGADLRNTELVEADLTDANLTHSQIYGASTWGLTLSGKTKQRNLVITTVNEPQITVDNIEVGQFIYLLLHNQKIRDVIDTIGKKGVLLLGRFTGGRIAVLERLRKELRNRGFVPMVFNFDRPETKDFTETIRLLAGLSHFVIADVTNPKSAPLELQATVPECMIPFQPIIEEGEEPFAMLKDLWIKHRDWVFEPIYYSSTDALVRALDEKIIKPAQIRFAELLARKAETMRGEHV